MGQEEKRHLRQAMNLVLSLPNPPIREACFVLMFEASLHQNAELSQGYSIKKEM